MSWLILAKQANLEKQIKELKLRIVDLETKSYSKTPQASSSSSAATVRRLESRIDELTNQLNQATKDRRRTSLSKDRDVVFKLAECERQKTRLEEEVRSSEEKIITLRKAMDDMVGAQPSTTASALLTSSLK